MVVFAALRAQDHSRTPSTGRVLRLLPVPAVGLLAWVRYCGRVGPYQDGGPAGRSATGQGRLPLVFLELPESGQNAGDERNPCA